MLAYRIGLFVFLMLSGGCLTSWKQVRLQNDVTYLRTELTELKKRSGLAGTSDVRVRLAELAATLQEIQTEVGLLSGRIESAEHAGIVNRENIEATREDLVVRLARLDEDLVTLQINLGIEVPARAPTSSLPLPTASVTATPGTSPVVAASPQPTPVAAKPPRDLSDRALYANAIELFDGANYDKARQGFSELIARYPSSDRADNARFWIGESYYRQEEFAASILEYQKVVEQHPRGDKEPAALYKQGLAFIQIGEKDGGLATLQELVMKYPKSTEAAQAKKELKKRQKR